MGEYEDQGGIGEDSDQDDMQSFTMWSHPAIEEDCDIDNTESGMTFFKSAAILCSNVHVYN